MITYLNSLTEVNITEYNGITLGLEGVKIDHHIGRQMDNNQDQINKNFVYNNSKTVNIFLAIVSLRWFF